VDVSLKRLLAEAGMDVEKDNVRIMPIPGATGQNVSFGLSAARALEEGQLDGFWANGMGCEVALRRGVGSLVLDVRRGDGPPAARHYTFPALVTTEQRIAKEPDSARAAIRAIMKAHKVLRENTERATEVGKKRFPAAEADLIAELIRRDLPYYDPTITEQKVTDMNRFAQDVGLLSAPFTYAQVVATQFSHLWSEPVWKARERRHSPGILFVNPPIYDFSACDFWLKPYGMRHVAGCVRTQAKLSLFDFLDRLISPDRFIKPAAAKDAAFPNPSPMGTFF
jgi:ABC-type nitrate/sulfonate/bicarbonate transport system substrate-binding protein